ncbi:MAG: glycosyltransferase family 4 protein [Bacteroidota bacterium]
MKQYRIAFLTSIDPRNKGALSGSSHYIYKALDKYVGEVDILGPVSVVNWFTRIITRISNRLPWKYNLSHSYFFACRYARRFSKKMAGKQYDFIFVARSATEVSMLKTDVPIIYFSDTTFKLLYNYYDWFSNFMRISEIEGNSIERRAIKKSAITILSSEWAANSAIEYYNAPRDKVHVIPFGPNVDNIPAKAKSLTAKDSNKCKLLFIGVEWERKGGQIAFNTLVELKKMGLDASLTVLGCTPPDNIKDDDLIVIPYLNKNIEEESRRFNALFEESHFFILPTKQECFGVVFCEASAFGLPSLATDTGGISSAVKDNINGFLFDVNDGGKEYAEKVYSIFTDYENKYIPLSVSSRELYDEQLNWESFGKSVRKLMDDYGS